MTLMEALAVHFRYSRFAHPSSAERAVLSLACEVISIQARTVMERECAKLQGWREDARDADRNEYNKG